MDATDSGRIPAPVDPAVVVTGMHRSGTSAAARVLMLAGASPGRGALWGPDAGNPTGHWENAELAGINEDLLRRLGGNWAGPPALRPGWEGMSRGIRRLAARGRAALARAGEDRPWIFKDPRLCVTLPFWIRLRLAPAVIAVHRHPAEVAKSLARRSNLGGEISLALWERHTSDLLANCRGLPVLVSRFEALLDDPGSWVDRARTFLADTGRPLRPAPDMAAIYAFLDPARRHHRITTSAGLTADQQRLRDRIEALDGAHTAFDPGPVASPSPEVAVLLAEGARHWRTGGRR